MKNKDKMNLMFIKMMNNSSVQLSEEGKEFWKPQKTGRWFYISSIHADGTLTIVSKNHTVFKGVNISHII